MKQSSNANRVSIRRKRKPEVQQGQTDEEGIYHLEQQFNYGDSFKIIRKQVEKYGELVKEQVENIERAKRDSKEAERLRNEVEELKKSKQVADF